MNRTLIALLLSACARHPRPVSFLDAPPHYVEVRPGTPQLCVSQVPAAGRVRDGASAVSAGLTHLQAGDLEQAGQALAEAGEHPAAQAARLALTLRQGDADTAGAGFLALAEHWPDDGCLHQAAAYAALANGRIDFAARLSAEALRLLPGAAEVVFLDGLIAAISGDLALATQRYAATLLLVPDHPAASLMLGAALLLQGNAALAVAPLRVAAKAGLPVDLLLLRASYGAGNLGEYLQIAAGLGLPLPGAAVIATSDDPVAAYRTALGLGEGQHLWAQLQTSMGVLDCELYWQSAPVAVGSFVGLARGSQLWLDPRTGAPGVGGLYDGTQFHRVIPGFMVQGGDPLGDGTGGPGYRFPDELDPKLRFVGPGVLAMANQGPDTNGSQFFVTDAATPHLDGRHTIIGQCDPPSLEVVRAIARVPTAGQDQPATAVQLLRITVSGQDPQALRAPRPGVSE